MQNYTIRYRPLFRPSPYHTGSWYAWVMVGGRGPKLYWWPVSEEEAQEWYNKNMPMRNGKANYIGGW